MTAPNRARGCAFVLGVLKQQQRDPLCRECNGYVKTAQALRSAFDEPDAAEFSNHTNITSEWTSFFAEAKQDLSHLSLPAAPVSQKKAGACKLPEGACFCKSSLALMQKI